MSQSLFIINLFVYLLFLQNVASAKANSSVKQILCKWNILYSFVFMSATI